MDGNTFDDELLTPQQVADKLQLHYRTINLYIKKKKLRAVRVGRYLRVRRSELARFLKEQEI